MLFLAPRKHLFATNLIILLVIYIMRKCLQLFCIIENKTGADGLEPEGHHRLQPGQPEEKDQDCLEDDSPLMERRQHRRGGFKIIPDAIHKSMHGFGYGEGHYQIFVEKKERNLPTKSRLNAATAEVKLNPN